MAIVLVGAQWGDECKGKISAHVVYKEKINYVYKAGIGPNAEHGIYWEKDGPYVKCNQLPLGFIRAGKDIKVRMGPGVCVDPQKLFAEMQQFRLDKNNVAVDPRCPIVKPEYIQWERQNLVGNSTYNGTGPCRADFVLRKATQAKDIPELKKMLLDVPEEINRIADKEQVMIECSQGAMLSLALSHDYPHVTSDNVTTCAAMDDVGLSWRHLHRVIMVVKSVPSREGNGPMGAVAEMSEAEIKDSAFKEVSSVDAAIRRKAKGIDFDLLKYAAMLNGPTEIALTFLDQYDPAMKDIRSLDSVTLETFKLMTEVEAACVAPVRYLETGKLYNSIIEL